MLLRTFTVLSVLLFGLCAAEKLPFLLPTCKRASSDYNSCLKHMAEISWPILTKGLPAEYDLPPLDPFFYEDHNIVVDSGGVYGKGSAINVTITGVRTTYFKEIRFHLNNDIYHMRCNYRVPQIFAEGIYEMHGSWAGFQFNGKGDFNVTIEDLTGTGDLLGIVKEDTLIVEHVCLIPIAKNFKVYADNSIDPEIGKLAVMFLNENWPTLYRVALPIAANYWDTYLTNLLNRYFVKISFSEAFP